MAATSRPSLDAQVSELFLAELANDIGNWEELAPSFDITEAEEEEIRQNFANQYGLQKRAMLRKWAEKLGREATYRKLMNIFRAANNRRLSDKVEEILQSPQGVMASFKQYLKDCYTSTPPTANDNEWPQLEDAPFVHPKLYLKPKKQSQVKQATDEEISLESILPGNQQGPQVVLLEGVAGCGKSTVSSYICQQWAEGKMFREIDLLIHLTLADPVLYSAQSIEDMIPHPSPDMHSAIAASIVDCCGKGCCFVMDGWEDLPEDHQKSSFIFKILRKQRVSQVALPDCSFIVTSCPIASAFLQPVVTKKVEILGFSSDKVDYYATQYLTKQERDPAHFITALNDNHHVRGLSGLPINATILLHLFLIIETGLPSTQMELFKCFILNLLIRHIKTKTHHHLSNLRDFSKLPGDLIPSFDSLCIIAYQTVFSPDSVSKSVQLFSSENLSQAGIKCFINDTFGLLKVVHTLTRYGYEPQYGFLHSSVRDFLCALRMRQLTAQEQARDFKHILTTNPSSLVLPFFAGITKLENEQIYQHLKAIGSRPPKMVQTVDILNTTRSSARDPRRLFLAYLHCLYEADNNREKMLSETFSVNDESIWFYYYRLSTHDFNVFSHFMIAMARKYYPKHIQFEFFDSLDGDHVVESGAKILMDQAQRTEELPDWLITLELPVNNLTHKGFGILANLSCSSLFHNLKGLIIGGNLVSTSSSGFKALKLLTEALAGDSHIDTVGIMESQFTSRHAYHLILLITQAKHLRSLMMSHNELIESVPLIVSAAKRLHYLDICLMGMRAEEFHQVGHILQFNTSLLQIRVGEDDKNVEPRLIEEFCVLVANPCSRSRLIMVNLYMSEEIFKKLVEINHKIQEALKMFNNQRRCQRPLEIKSFFECMKFSKGIGMVEMDQAIKQLPQQLLTGSQ